MLRSIRNVKLLKCVSLICLSPLFVFYSSLKSRSSEVLASGVIIVYCDSADSYGLDRVTESRDESKKEEKGGRGGERRKHEKMQEVIGRTSIPARKSFRDFTFFYEMISGSLKI